MTVDYIRSLKQTMNNSLENYETGYRQCSEEILKVINSLPNIYPEQRQSISNRCRQIWNNRRLQNSHPYQRRINQQKCLQIIINDSYSSSSSSSPSSPKLWKPYM